LSVRRPPPPIRHHPGSSMAARRSYDAFCPNLVGCCTYAAQLSRVAPAAAAKGPPSLRQCGETGMQRDLPVSGTDVFSAPRVPSVCLLLTGSGDGTARTSNFQDLSCVLQDSSRRLPYPSERQCFVSALAIQQTTVGVPPPPKGGATNGE